MIIVSSLDHAEEAFRKYDPSYVISLLDCNEPTPPVFNSLRPDNHLRLIGDCAKADAKPKDGENGGENECVGEPTRCTRILDVAKAWKKDGQKSPILIHCNEGAARSMTVAFILMCAIEDKQSESSIAKRMRAAAPHADPNLLLVSEADAALGRNDRMIEAVLDLCPSCTAIGAPITVFSLND